MRNLQLFQPCLKFAMASLFAGFSASGKLLLCRNVRRAMRHLLVHHEDEIVVRSVFGKGSSHGYDFVSQHINSLANVKEHATLSAGASVDHRVEVGNT